MTPRCEMPRDAQTVEKMPTRCPRSARHPSDVPCETVGELTTVFPGRPESDLWLRLSDPAELRSNGVEHFGGEVRSLVRGEFYRLRHA